MNEKLIIMTCPYCHWSASHVESDSERKNRLIGKLIAHLELEKDEVEHQYVCLQCDNGTMNETQARNHMRVEGHEVEEV